IPLVRAGGGFIHLGSALGLVFHGERHALYRRLWLHPKIHLVFASKNSYNDVSQALDQPQML
ncbi:hypothetical protein B296_00009260, partial [Ensete ventricosum]